MLIGTDRQLPAALADAAHRFDGVDDQVQQYLLPLYPISFDGRQVSRELRLYLDAVLQHFAAGQGQDIENRLVDLEIGLLRGRLFDEGTDPATDLADSVAVPDDPTERLPDLLEVGRPD